MIDVTKHTPEYYKRMKNSVISGGKKELIKRAKEGNILDLGTGDGTIAISLKEQYPNSDVYAVDLSTAGKEHMEEAGVHFIQADLSHLNQALSGEKNMQFDSIILSAVLHEILSYSEDKRLHHVFFENINRLMKPGGKLLIRDGIQTRQALHEKSFTLFPQKISVIELIQMLAEFEQDNLKAFKRYYQSKKFKYTQGKETQTVIISTTDEIFQELIFTLNWGKEAWKREKMERNYFSTQTQLVQQLETSIPGQLTFSVIEHDEMYYKKIKEQFGISVDYPTMQVIEYQKNELSPL